MQQLLIFEKHDIFKLPFINLNSKLKILSYQFILISDSLKHQSHGNSGQVWIMIKRLILPFNISTPTLQLGIFQNTHMVKARVHLSHVGP